MKVRIVAWLAVCGMMAMAGSPALGQGKSAESGIHSMFPVDNMINQAADNIARRYNLNDSQHQATLKMLRDGVNRFLLEHQDEMYPIVRDLAKGGFKGTDTLTPEQLMRIGKAALPLVAEAKKAILEANNEWGKILSEEQKKLHDWDLREMEGQFDQIRDNFDQMSKGKAVDNPIFPEPKIETPEPPRPSKPPAATKGVVSEQPVIEKPGEADPFDAAVEKFIKDYDLEPAQATAARSIGREFKQYADVYRKSHRTDFEAAEKKAADAGRSGDLEARKEAEAELDKLNGRIQTFLQEMNDRLMSIPREAQKRAYEEKRSGAASPAKKPAEESKAKDADQDKDKEKKTEAKTEPVKKTRSKTKDKKNNKDDK